MPHRSSRRRAWCVGVFIALAVVLHAAAQPVARESAVKAAFLFKFPAFVEWPAAVFARADQPFVIGVMGDEEVAADLEQIVAGRKVDTHPVVVRRIADNAPVSGVQVLYIANRAEPKLRQAIDSAQGPVLIVTEQAGALRAGSVLNFSAEESRVRFSASLASADARNLKLSARLLAVAQNVEARGK